MIRQGSTYSAVLVQHPEWNELIVQFPEATIFHSLPWLTAVSAAHGLETLLVAVMYASRCVGLWPCLVMRKGPLRIIGSPLPGWSTPYLGPLIAPDADASRVIQTALEHPQLNKYAYFACKVSDQHREVDLLPMDFTPVLRYETFRLDLTIPEAQLWSNIRHECQRHIRKATKEGVEVRVEQNADCLDEYWEMEVESFSRSGLKPSHDRRFLTELWKHVQPTGRLHALSALHRGGRIAGLITVSDDNVMYNWSSASRTAFRHLSAPSLLQWEAIRLAKQLAIPTFDMISTSGGAGKFKESFGPQIVATSTHWERSPSRLLMSMKRGYEKYLRWQQRTPALAKA